MDEIMDIVRREAEACESLQGIQFTHSICGGTGSGMGCHLLQELNTWLGNPFIQTISVAPSHKYDTGIKLYNSLLGLHRIL